MSARSLGAWLIPLLVALALLSLCVGAVWLSPREVFLALANSDSPYAIIVRELRLPRTLFALLVGGALGIAGAAMQGFTRNALADPSVLGVSSCASLGAVIAFYNAPLANATATMAAGALTGAAIGATLLLAFAWRGAGAITLILAGIALSSLAAAFTVVALNLAPNPFAAYEALTWLMGSVADRTLGQLTIAAPLVIVGGGLFLSARHALDALALGERTAASLGIDMRRLHGTLIVATTLAFGGAVAFTGAVGFVGLIAPHLVRRRVGAAPGNTLLASALAGALIVLLADLLVRAAPGTAELKLGVVTALVGAPIFIALLVKHRRQFA